MPDTKSPYDDEVTDPYSGDDTKNPHEPSGGEGEAPDTEGENGDEAPPPKRGPGRPRKSAQ